MNINYSSIDDTLCRHTMLYNTTTVFHPWKLFDVVSSNLDQDEVYNIIWQSFSVTCDSSVVFSGSYGLLHE
jgi:hypothetical protein